MKAEVEIEIIPRLKDRLVLIFLLLTRRKIVITTPGANIEGFDGRA